MPAGINRRVPGLVDSLEVCLCSQQSLDHGHIAVAGSEDEGRVAIAVAGIDLGAVLQQDGGGLLLARQRTRVQRHSPVLQ